MEVHCNGTMADVKMLPEFTSKRSPGSLSDSLYNNLEGNPGLQPQVVRGNGEDPEHQFEYTTATVDRDGRQGKVYQENQEDGYVDRRVDAPQRASRKNTSWQGVLRHRLCLSMEKDPSLTSRVQPSE